MAEAGAPPSPEALPAEERPEPDRMPMRQRVIGSVRFRLVSTVVLVVGVALFCGGFMLVRWVEATLTNDLRVRNERVLESMAALLGQGQVPAELFSSPSELEGRLDQQMSDDLLGGAQDVAEVISTTYFYLDGPAFTQLKVGGVDTEGKLVLFGRQGPALPDPANAVEVTRDVSTRWGTLTLHAVSPLDEIERSVGALRAALWLGLPVLVIFAGAMTWVITGQTLAPVGAITRRVRELSSTTLDARVPVPPTDDEIALLARTMNDMLDRLQKASMKERQFISDASHELRSPVASIRAQLETALRYPDDVDWPAVARIVLSEDERLEHLVGNLLALARLEEGRFGPRTELDLDDLVMAQTPRMTGVQVDLSGVSAGRVWGNADELTSVIRNLLDNAARHARSTVAVSVREAGPWVVLGVADDGSGVPPERRREIFERFARLEEGRSRDQGGTGLGLALSRRIVERHGGSIHVEDGPLGGANFVVSLPAASWTGAGHDAADDHPAGHDSAGHDSADHDTADHDTVDHAAAGEGSGRERAGGPAASGPDGHRHTPIP